MVIKIKKEEDNKFSSFLIVVHGYLDGKSQESKSFVIRVVTPTTPKEIKEFIDKSFKEIK